MTPPGSLFPTTPFTVTKDQFNAFHSIDRALYSRLIFAISRDPTESMRVMALWLWLERHSGHGRNFVQKLLIFPVGFVNLLAQESVMCLKFVGDDSAMISESSWNVNDVPLLHSVLGGPMNLFYFIENRIRILEGVDKILKETCLKAFEDIFLVKSGFGGRGAQSSAAVPLYTRGGNVVIGEGSIHAPYGGYENWNMIGNAIMQEGVAFGNEDHQEMGEVEADQRTIFLTFSKGYPTTELEVEEFFTRRYGDIIEAVHMQDVLPEKQVLYARLVVRTAGLINVVLEGGSKTKFTINGKHVWARKYVKKRNQTN